MSSSSGRLPVLCPQNTVGFLFSDFRMHAEIINFLPAQG